MALSAQCAGAPPSRLGTAVCRGSNGVIPSPPEISRKPCMHQCACSLMNCTLQVSISLLCAPPSQTNANRHSHTDNAGFVSLTGTDPWRLPVPLLNGKLRVPTAPGRHQAAWQVISQELPRAKYAHHVCQRLHLHPWKCIWVSFIPFEVYTVSTVYLVLNYWTTTD